METAKKNSHIKNRPSFGIAICFVLFFSKNNENFILLTGHELLVVKSH